MNTERPYKILLVDDSESDRAIYAGYLLTDESFDYQILEAETLEESWEVWRSQLPDLVLVDLNLPDGSGLELLEVINKKDLKNLSPKCPVIVITGQGNERIAVQAMKLGARDYLIKADLTADVLGNCVKNALNQGTPSSELTEFPQASENYNLDTITDIPDRKQAEQENIRLRKRFQFLLASSPTIIYSCKPYGDYGATFISDNTETILGYQPEQFITQENFWANHLHPEDAPKIFA
jgi:DNA-binding NtrC family response regulator